MHCTIAIPSAALTFPSELSKMSRFPSPVLVRLQELKLWQGNYDNILQNRSREDVNPSDYETIEGLSALDSTHDSSRSTPLSSPGRNREVDWDQKTISPSKPFEQLLEEKLAEDTLPQVQQKPKRPFLKKGAGLVRYKLKERSEVATNRFARYKVKEQNESVHKLRKPMSKGLSDNKIRDKQFISGKKCHGGPTPRKSCLKNSINMRKEPEIDLTPLKMPDLMIKPKGTWHKAGENAEIAEETKKILDDAKTPKHHYFNSHIIGKINEFALRHFLPSNSQKNHHKNNIPSDNAETQAPHNLQGNESLFEKASENELRIFEALEERADNSSFSSTNSSIVRLLSSTPNKIKMHQATSPIPEENRNPTEEHREQFANCDKHRLDVDKKLQDLNVKSDVLHDFLRSLKKIGGRHDSKRLSSSESRESVNEKSPKDAPDTPDTSFSDDEKWSNHTVEDSGSQSPSSFLTDFDTTYRGEAPKRVDVAVNTTFTDEETDKKCQNCEKLQAKLEKLSKEIPDIKAEKARVCDFAKDLEKKRDQLNKEMQKMRKKYEAELCQLKDEFTTEKKKYIKDKMVYDVYVKDSQNRPTRKEREELSDLKKELLEVKELMKLKDTKNASTQARLRNQIRQLEKENSDFKITTEKLQKENAKLTVCRNMRKPSEVKMLHEINKNLTKLTEETLKNNISRSDKCSVTSNGEEVTSYGKTSKEMYSETNEAEYSSSKVKKKHDPLKSKCIVNAGKEETSGLNMTAFTNVSLEKQYEDVFGQVPSPGPSINSPNESKREKFETVFEDGSKEIKYSNGNSKTISPNGNLILVKYYNGDLKETNLLENTQKYYYAENGTWHTQFSDGSELLEYPSGQKEKKFKDGTKEIICVDGSHVMKMTDGTEEVVYPDGSKIIIKNLAGERILFLPNGQKEVHTKDHKRREYPDGTVKILFPDGTQETRYSSGRIRVKDVSGTLIMDSHTSVS